MTRRVLVILLVIAGILSPILTACGATATPTAVPTVAPTKAPPTTVPPTAAPTKVPATATAVLPTPTQGPKVGGTFVFATTVEPDTLDPHKTGFAISDQVNNLLGGSLVAMDKDGKIVPFLAEKWTISTDGKTYTFTIKKGVKFHNGNPLTAKSFVYTFNRAKDPATKATASGSMLGPVTKIEAPDDNTLVMTLAAPNFWMMSTLASGGYLMPLDQAAVEKSGD
jgi:peptide/nickel transport system substrate-binding protein